MKKIISIRVSAALYDVIAARLSLSKQSLTKEVIDLIELGLSKDRHQTDHITQPFLIELGSINSWLKSLEQAVDSTARLKPKVDRIADLTNLSVKSLEAIENYLEKLHTRLK